MSSDAFYKNLVLKVSDTVSSRLKINFDMKEMSVKKSTYQSAIKAVPSFAYIALFKREDKEVVIGIDARIIYRLSNRMLGGEGEIEDKTHAHFTESERLMGREMAEWLAHQYREDGMSLLFERDETDISRVHYFYPDDRVQNVEINCRMNSQAVGPIMICHAEDLLA